MYIAICKPSLQHVILIINPASAVMQKLSKIKQLLTSDISPPVISAQEVHGELVVLVDTEELLTLMQFLRDDKNCRFSALMDICAVDYPSRTERFEVVYHMLSVEHNLRVRVKLCAGIEDIVPSLTDLFGSAGWYEREVWDLYGVYFKGNTDLRRILTDYGFVGHPMRKDFPLTGYTEVRYDLIQEKVLYEPVKLSQEFRNFDFSSPWYGPNYILPGDEKASK